MKFFCFHRDRAGSAGMRNETAARHLAYMDGFDDALSLRGPTFNDQDELTGSVHVVDLPTSEDAWHFALEEPGYRAGVYRDVLVHRWHDVLGGVQPVAPATGASARLYLVLGFEPQPAPLSGGVVPGPGAAVFGHLVTDDGTLRLGTAAIVQAESPGAARGVLDIASLEGVEVYPWMFGIRA